MKQVIIKKKNKGEGGKESKRKRKTHRAYIFIL